MNQSRKKKSLFPVFFSSVAPYLLGDKLHKSYIEKFLEKIDLEKEYNLILEKKSRLSSKERELVIYAYEKEKNKDKPSR
jgi:hypothetical protein